MMDYLNQAGMSAEKQAEFISRLNEKLIEYSGQADAAVRATNETFKEFADDISQLDAAGNVINVLNLDKLADAWGVAFRQAGALFGGQGMDYLYNYARALEQQNVLLEENEKKTRLEADALGKYSAGVDNLNKSLANLDWSSMEALYNSLQDYNAKHPENMISVPINMEFDPTKAQSEYEKMLEIGNMQIHAIFSNLQNIASQEGVAIPEEFYKQAKSVVEGNKSFSFIDFDNIIKLFNSPKAKAAIRESKTLYEAISPNDRTAATFRTKLAQLASASGVELSTMTKYFMKAGDKIEDYAKRIKEAIEDLEKKLKEMRTTNQMIAEGGHGPLQGFSEEEIKKIQMQVAVLKELFPFLQGFTKTSGSGRKSDPRLQNLKEEISLTKKLYDEYHKLEKQIGATKAAEKIQEIYSNTIKTLQDRAGKYGFKFELPFTDENLKSNMQHFIDKMKELQKLRDKKGKPLFPNIGKEIDEAVAQLEDVDLNSLQKALEKKLKELSDRISRTKTAKEFYDKILSTTGDHSLASKVAESIFGQNGSALQKALADQVRGMTNKVELPEGIISADNIIDYKALRQFAEANKDELGKMYEELVNISEQGQKDLAKTYEGYLKDLEKAKTYADKRIELARYTANQIAEINARTDLPQTEKERLTAGYEERERRKQGELEWEAFKEMPMYVQMFDDLDNASGTMLSNMKAKLTDLQSEWGATLNPTQLKELQSRLSEIDAQLAKKNPFKTLADAMRQYRALSKGGTQADAERKLVEATEKREAALQKLGMVTDNARMAQKKYNEAVAEYGSDSEQAKNAKLLWDQAERGVDAAGKLVEQTGLSEKEAQRLVDAWKKVKDAIGLSLGEVFEIAHSLGDLAGGIGKLTEVFGGSEEDVQYWDDIAAGLNEVTGGIENMVQAAISGNPIGIATSAITAIPNMISGFSKLFSAGKIRRANKEIKRQQQLLEQLEYTYGRLTSAADKLFGKDYVSNYQQQIRNLEAQQTAYLKQAEAERSKGKDEDEAKTQEYLNQARETANKIKELQDDLVAHFTGQSRTDAARQMAKSWIDARASMSDTFAAIKGDYQDLIKNMIVEGAAARVIENALAPVWDSMEKMLEKNDVEGAIDSLVNGMDSALTQANNGMEVLWNALEARGYDMKKLIGDTDSEYTGIAKSVAGATSEEINNVAAIGNTLMYYVSPIPRIDENLARVVALMEGRGASAIPQTASAGWTDWQQQAMDNYNAIARNTADTVVECRRAAEACERITKLIKTKGSTSGINVFLNS